MSADVKDNDHHPQKTDGTIAVEAVDSYLTHSLYVQYTLGNETDRHLRLRLGVRNVLPMSSRRLAATNFRLSGRYRHSIRTLLLWQHSQDLYELGMNDLRLVSPPVAVAVLAALSACASAPDAGMARGVKVRCAGGQLASAATLRLRGRGACIAACW